MSMSVFVHITEECKSAALNKQAGLTPPVLDKHQKCSFNTHCFYVNPDGPERQK